MSVAPCQVAPWRRQGVVCPVGLYTLPFVPPSVSRRIPGLSGSGYKSTSLSICGRPGAGWGHPHKSETWESCFRPGVLGPGLLLPRAPASRIQKSSPSIWWVGLSRHGACWPRGLLYIKAPHFIHIGSHQAYPLSTWGGYTEGVRWLLRDFSGEREERWEPCKGEGVLFVQTPAFPRKFPLGVPSLLGWSPRGALIFVMGSWGVQDGAGEQELCQG